MFSNLFYSNKEDLEEMVKKNQKNNQTNNKNENYDSGDSSFEGKFTTSSPIETSFKEMSLNNKVGFPLSNNDTVYEKKEMDVDEKPEIVLFIKNANHPKVKIEQGDAENIIEIISNERDLTLKEHPEKVRFQNVSFKFGYIKFIVSNEETAKWISDGVSNSQRKDLVCTKTQPENSALIRASVRVRARKKELSEDEFFEHLQLSNPGLKLDNAKVFNKQKLHGGSFQLIYFGLPDEAKDWLEEHQYSVFFDLGQSKVVLLDQEKRTESASKRRAV